MPELPMDFWDGHDRGLTIKEAAEKLGYSRWTIARMIEAGELKSYGDGKKKRIPLSSIVQYSTTSSEARTGQKAARREIKKVSQRHMKAMNKLEELLK